MSNKKRFEVKEVKGGFLVYDNVKKANATVVPLLCRESIEEMAEDFNKLNLEKYEE